MALLGIPFSINPGRLGDEHPWADDKPSSPPTVEFALAVNGPFGEQRRGEFVEQRLRFAA
jgi:hypothetical protein